MRSLTKDDESDDGSPPQLDESLPATTSTQDDECANSQNMNECRSRVHQQEVANDGDNGCPCCKPLKNVNGYCLA